MRRTVTSLLVVLAAVAAVLVGGQSAGADEGGGARSADVPSRWSSVTTGGQATCAIDDEKHLWCWGYNQYGQLGLGDQDNRSTPTQVGGSRWRSVTSSYYTTCGIKINGSGWCWGDNEYGGVGGGVATTDTLYVLTPQRVASKQTWSTLVPSYQNTCGTTAKGALFCWGTDQYGSIGDGAGDGSTDTPVRIAASQRWASVTPGWYSVCALTTDKSAYCWGYGGYGTTGSGDTADVSRPRALEGRWRTLDMVSTSACGVRTTGKAYCWGENSYGHLGTGSTDSYVYEPSPMVKQGASFSRVVPMDYSTCAVRRADGTLRCLGDNSYAQFGDGTNDASTTPVTAGGGLVLDRPAIGDFNVCGLKGKGALWCWGDNNYGQLGVGDTGTYLSPVRVGSSPSTPRTTRSGRAPGGPLGL